METILNYIFLDPIPLTWLIQDVIALALSLVVILTIVKRAEHPVPRLLEVIAFVFVYASVYENAAGPMGLFTYGRSYLMVGSVPITVPLIEAIVMVTGLWFLEHTPVPDWAKPVVVGLFGMLQDFSLDSLAIRQVYTTNGVTSGRWNWLIQATDANILNIPVFNYPGWMLIMLYGTAMALLGRWWYRKSGYKPLVGVLYPFLSMFIALLLMISPISNFLLWLGPIFAKGDQIEWVMLGVHLLVPTLLLIFLWRGKLTKPFTREDYPIFLVPIGLHLSDILFTIIGGFTNIFWIVLLSSAIHIALLIYALSSSRKQFPKTNNT
jgi:hypothetical protein